MLECLQKARHRKGLAHENQVWRMPAILVLLSDTGRSEKLKATLSSEPGQHGVRPISQSSEHERA